MKIIKYFRHFGIIENRLMKQISLVIPVYHEEESLPYFFEAVNPIVDSLKEKYDFELVFVTDMPDKGTYSLLLKKQKEQSNIVVVRLSRSFGHEEAVAAGLKVAKGDAVIPLDGDLQDDPTIIPTMIEKWEEGFKVVNGKRSSREEKGLSKLFVKVFYHLFHKWSKKINVPENVGDFRLLDRVVVDEINKLGEKYRVLKIEVPYVGFETTEVAYQRKNRVGGKTHYKKSALFKNAFDYFTIISDKLLMVVFDIALVSGVLSVLSLLVELIVFIVDVSTGPQILVNSLAYMTWLIIGIAVLLFAFVEFSLFIIGGYANRAYVEANDRPTYIIESVTYSDGKKE